MQPPSFLARLSLSFPKAMRTPSVVVVGIVVIIIIIVIIIMIMNSGIIKNLTIIAIISEEH